jgi:Ser/Thr protein kinase RdoA (MazF antagonist)
LEELLSGEPPDFDAMMRREDALSSLAREAIALIRQTAPPLLAPCQRWATVELPLQWRLTDIWHDHVLFSGERVTGVIDFDAATIDTLTGDIARLLGSLVADDTQRWQLGLAAYESQRSLTSAEREIIPLLDASGTVLSAANWVRWLSSPVERRPVGFDDHRAAARLGRLCQRMRALAGTSSLRTAAYGQPY